MKPTEPCARIEFVDSKKTISLVPFPARWTFFKHNKRLCRVCYVSFAAAGMAIRYTSLTDASEANWNVKKKTLLPCS